MFDLTPQERRALIFLFSVAFLGFTLELFSKCNSRLRSWVSAEQALKKIDLNSADKEELMSLPGIGEKIALRILDYRKLKGKFAGLEELKSIKGITAGRYRQIADSLCLQ